PAPPPRRPNPGPSGTGCNGTSRSRRSRRRTGIRCARRGSYPCACLAPSDCSGPRFRQQRRIPYRFPEVAIRVLEVTCVATPEGVLRRLDDYGPGRLRLLHHGIHFGLRTDVVSQGHVGGARRSQRQAAVVGNARPWPEGQLQAWLEIEEGYRTMLEFLADDALAGEPEAVAVERECPRQVVDAQGDNAYSSLHGYLPPGLPAQSLIVIPRAPIRRPCAREGWWCRTGERWRPAAPPAARFPCSQARCL